MIEWSFSATSGMSGADLCDDFYDSLYKEQIEKLLKDIEEIKINLQKRYPEAEYGRA